MHPVETLFSAMAEVEPYPEGVVRFPERLPGTGFFPGGSGLWNTVRDQPLPAMPIGGIMVLGHDFHSEDAFRRSLQAGTEVKLSPTWPNLLALLKDAGVDPAQCFFTNAFMGLRRGSQNTGRFPGARDLSFVDRCRRFLLKQISLQKPRAILALGRFVPAVIAPLSRRLHGWARARTFSDLDAVSPIIDDVVFAGITTPACSVVALTHPCLRGSNIRRRRYGALVGHEAELALVREAASLGRGSVV